MPMHRKNKCKAVGATSSWRYNQKWYLNNCKRVRMRKKMARRSKQINRARAR